MHLHTITITHGNPSTGELILNPANLAALTSDNVEWIIQPGSGVSSIVAILGKDGCDDVWKIRPKKDNRWKGKIKSKSEIPNPYVYYYSIRWKAGSNIPPDHDPIISISPSSLHDEKILKLIPLLLAAGLAILFVLKFWDKKRK